VNAADSTEPANGHARLTQFLLLGFGNPADISRKGFVVIEDAHGLPWLREFEFRIKSRTQEPYTT